MAYGSFTLDRTGQAIPSNGGLGEVANPEGQDLIITSCILYVITPSAGAANINVGYGAAGADNNNELSAVAINGAITGTAWNGLAFAAEAQRLVWGANQVLNATGSAACAAFRGRVYVEYQRTADEE
jgi:hypothetical protein